MEDDVSRAAYGTSVHDLDFASLRSKLGPLAAVSTRICTKFNVGWHVQLIVVLVVE